MAETSKFNLNVLGLSVQSLLVVLILLMVIQWVTCLATSEGLKSDAGFDKYQAAYNQEQDNTLGATSAGNALNRKVVDAWGEGLMGGYEAPSFWDGSAYNMEQAKGAGGVVTTSRPGQPAAKVEGMDDPLVAILHGGSAE
jgi:hypothetical protein